MIKGGARPTKIDHRDYDFHRSFGTIGQTPVFPDTYITDTVPSLMPNQEITDGAFTPPVAPLPYGCTDETSASLTTDLLNGVIKRPDIIEAITNANAKGGIDLRTSLMAAIQLKWITGFFIIQPHQLDWFDSIRLAMVSGIPEKRSTSAGSAWFPKFEQVGPDGIVPIPDSFSVSGTPWHNYKIAGWKLIGDQPYLVAKSWQGPAYGDKGYCYFSRPLINTLMSIPGAAAFTATRGELPPIQTVSTTIMQWLMSNLRILLGLQY